MSNPYGDVELEPRSMRALAHPVRLAILSRLQGYGPSTATALAPLVGATPSVTSWHLRHLAEHGLVRDADVEADGRQRWWEAVGGGFRFAATDDESQDAASLLTRVLIDQAEHLPAQWARDAEPLLEPQWRRSAGLSNTTVLVSADELGEIEAAIEEVLAPYVLRKADATAKPAAGARRVRMLRYVLPTAPPDDTAPVDETSAEVETS
ncbi:putative ArsR-family transcriptional regulator [Janibacter sp. HTCC2649]|uniref:helix-turn-helix domain-containing protein n=1 Tax=Janibacter sp. HTCC2649 TaxID=313589 RepID=UPI000066E9CA|nr:helix-turn-helix domain-containing protein [Janibacter sp. HTCC2649]EAP99494.1 putative ArsR-family transcriptional regulator [Janibacter sp. HTCC2649]